MNYLLISLEKGGVVRNIPFIFPSDLSHKKMSSILKQAGFSGEVVAAGKCKARVDCYGESLDLGVESRGRSDNEIINGYDHRKGVVDDLLSVAELLGDRWRD